MSIILASTSIFLHFAAAQSSNTTSNNTTPNTSSDRIGWKSSPDGRSTMDIIWSCASVLLVCTYKCLHLNISSFEENRAGWHRTKKWGFPYCPEWFMIKKWLRKIKWMGIILIGPEIGVAVACNRWMKAREEVQRAKLEFPDETLTLTHGFYALAGGFAADIGKSRECPADNGLRTENLRRLNLTAYVALCRENSSSPIPIITEDDISDRSKSDFFTKTFAIVQSSWLVIQIIARISAGLPVSELELVTTAYVLCAIVMYGFWWYKPFDVEHVTILQLQNPDPGLIERSPWRRRHEIDIHSAKNVFWVDNVWMRYPVRRGVLVSKRPSLELKSILVYSVTTVFSAIHLVAWNWDFPSPVSRMLWRIFGLSTTAAGLLIPGVTFLYLRWRFPSVSHMGDVVVTLFVLVVFPYIVSRLGLTVLVFYTFCSLPKGAYATIDWATYLPHFS